MLTYMIQALIAVTTVTAIAFIAWVLVEGYQTRACVQQFADLDFPESQMFTVLRMWRAVNSALRY